MLWTFTLLTQLHDEELLSLQCFLGDGVQRRRGDSERERHERERREMEAHGGAGGKVDASVREWEEEPQLAAH